MAKKPPAKIFICKSCGAQSQRWAGKCSDCGEWNSIEELTGNGGARFEAPVAVRPHDRRYAVPVPITQVEESKWDRISTGISEIDLVLGGGIVPGSLILIGGEPGVGKSTLVLEMAREIVRAGKVLYISGEESAAQIALRAKRMGIEDKNLLLSSEIYAENISAMLTDTNPVVLFVDSIQTILKENLVNQAGTVTQLRESTQVFLETAKRTGIPIFLTGHITKEGLIAGPKVLEHLVDTVLYFEGDRVNYYRILRAVKNRFGAVGDTAIFEMVAGGLKQVTDRNSLFVTSHSEERSGSVISSVMEGSRAIAVEVQALVTKSSFGQARRMAEGLDNRRVILLAAVLEKYLGLALSQSDIFSNLAGGLTIDEPSLDLAIAVAIGSSFKERVAPRNTAYLGEVGLSGEVRPIGQMALRLKALAGVGIESVVIPSGNKEEALSFFPTNNIKAIGHLKDLGDW
ncbi:DNA repair protein RadA [Leptospira ilyithenensis]|uniref:DNA repair protein RadA n=1 Tax=Leptospira ilyithenensis TaxID=2484901 RepID=A0A4V3JWP1_9LEPT|nr:DNA repair protein RadA [Leptospira ilyithenensis]TGN07049.1 DNA repair protein RadA [Leptospira ilyithenensis]